LRCSFPSILCGLAPLPDHRDPFSVAKFLSLGGLRVTLDTTCIPSDLSVCAYLSTRLLILSFLFRCQDFLCLEGLRVPLTRLLILFFLFRCQDFFCLDDLRVPLTGLLILSF
jgi:hypothetical protein